MTVYDDIRATLTRLEEAGVDPPKLTAAYHQATDEQATAVLEALDTLPWVVAGGAAGTGAVWLEAKDGRVEFNVFLLDDRRPRPDSPILARARAIIAKAGHRG